MKTSITKIPRLFEIKTDRTQKIIKWDEDNAYPFRYMWLADKSVTATACIDLFGKFLNGEGWVDRVFGESMINEQLNGDQFGEQLFSQWALHRGSAIIVGINGLFEHSSYQIEPFHRVRKGDGDRAGWYGVHEHWGKTGARFYPKDIEWFPPYTEDEGTIMKYIEQAGSFENFKGMILYTSVDPYNYPTPKFAAAMDDVETEANIAIYKRRNATTGFMASHIFKFTDEFTTDPSRSEMEQMLQDFQGAPESSKILMIDGVDSEDGQDLTIEKVDIQDVDRIFEHTEESASNNIRKSFLAPRALIGQEESTGFDTERVPNSRDYYNSLMPWDRMRATAPLKMLVPNFERPIKVGDNWDVVELYQDAPEPEPDANIEE